MKICRVMKYYVSLNFLPCIKRRRAINHRHVLFGSYRSLQLGSEVIALSLEISRVRHSLGKQEIQLSNYFKVLLIVSYYVCHGFNSNEPLIRSHLLVAGFRHDKYSDTRFQAFINYTEKLVSAT